MSSITDIMLEGLLGIAEQLSSAQLGIRAQK